ncbi:HNH endonuclease [Leifsonia aquatica]|uniref:HNH endonuclease n=1 Tax=Leifsonia aquatica TaxID=144185 RepID=UPI000468DF21|nr:HNH endonuclease [Leifsonia aquatica]
MIVAAGIPGRTTAQHRKNRAALKQLTRDHNLPCALCGQPIDCDIPRGDPDAFEYDHAKSITAYPELADDPSNGQPSHKRCNGSKGQGDGRPGLGDPSEIW